MTTSFRDRLSGASPVGSAHKFGLFRRRETHQWVQGFVNNERGENGSVDGEGLLSTDRYVGTTTTRHVGTTLRRRDNCDRSQQARFRVSPLSLLRGRTAEARPRPRDSRCEQRRPLGGREAGGLSRGD